MVDNLHRKRHSELVGRVLGIVRMQEEIQVYILYIYYSTALFFNPILLSHASHPSRHLSTNRRRALQEHRPPRMLLQAKQLLGHTCWRATARMMSLESLMVIRFSRKCAL